MIHSTLYSCDICEAAYQGTGVDVGLTTDAAGNAVPGSLLEVQEWTKK